MQKIFYLSVFGLITLLFVGCSSNYMVNSLFTTFEVHVTDEKGKPLEGVEVEGVSLSYGSYGGYTNEAGRARIRENAQGILWVKAHKNGYERGWVDINQNGITKVILKPLKK